MRSAHLGTNVCVMSTKQLTQTPPIAQAITLRLEQGDPSTVVWLSETANIPRESLRRKLATGGFKLDELDRIAAAFGTRASALLEDAERIEDGEAA